MSFTRPTLSELVTRVEGDFRTGLGLAVLLRRSFEKVAARTLAGLAHSLFGFMVYVEKQAFPDTAEDEYLDRWAAIWGIARQEATFAEFTASVTGTADTVIPAGRTYRRSDGKEYVTQAEVTLPGSIDLVAVESGSASEVEVGDVVSILSPIAGLDANATVTVVTTEPEDAEDDASMRDRLLDRIQNPPSGGAPNDYLQWALAVPGITRAWVGPQALGPGTVVVYVVSDDEDPITPSGAKIDEVADAIEEVRPVTANVSVTPPVLLPLDMTISIKPNTLAVKAAIEAELKDMLLRDAALAGSYKSPGVTHTGTILLSRLNEAISIAAGEEDHSIDEINGDATPGNITPDDGELITLGEITWQTLA